MSSTVAIPPALLRQRTHPYRPSKGVGARLSRRLMPLRARRILKIAPDRPVISFTFDDCPVSAVENGVMPLGGYGWKSTVYVAGGLLGKTNHHGPQIIPSEVRNLHRAGHEIGGHTLNHLDAKSVSCEQFMDDIEANQTLLGDIGVPPSRTFAYPFGQTSTALKSRLSKTFDGVRGIEPGYHRNSVDLNQVRSMPLFSGRRFDQLIARIFQLENNPGWMTIFTHDVRPSPTEWGCTPAELLQVADAAHSVNALVLPVCEAIDYLKTTSPQRGTS